MDEQRQQAYMELVQVLLQCEQGQEEAMLAAQPELVDEGLVLTALAFAQMVGKQQEEGAQVAAQWLMDFAADLAEKLGMSLPLVDDETEEMGQEDLDFLNLLMKAEMEDVQQVPQLFAQNLQRLQPSLGRMMIWLVEQGLKQGDSKTAEACARLIGNIVIKLSEFQLGNRSQNIEIVLAGYAAVLMVYTQGNSPEIWATTQNNIAIAYSNRIKGDIAENLEKAITGYEAALKVHTQEDFPIDWAMTQNNMANVYVNRIKGDRAENLEKAITGYEAALKVRTRKDFPIQWANTQNNMASAYSNRIKGDVAENLEKAITGYEAALKVHTQEDLPIDWAGTQNNMANVYVNRIKGDRAENLEKAIAGYDAVLKVYTREDFPIQWASTQNNMANAYSDRIKGDETENLKKAITGYDEVLNVRTRKDFPIQWAMTQRGYASLYEQLGQPELSLRHYHDALEVFTANEFPRDWAIIQLGIARIAIKHQGDYTVAVKTLEISISHLLARRSDMTLLAETIFELARSLHYIGQLDEARTHFRDCIRLYKRLDSPLQEAAVTAALGNLEMQMGYITDAQKHLQSALAYYQRADDDKAGDRIASIQNLLQHLPTPESIA